jgi:hypothetical protein
VVAVSLSAYASLNLPALMVCGKGRTRSAHFAALAQGTLFTREAVNKIYAKVQLRRGYFKVDDTSEAAKLPCGSHGAAAGPRLRPS